MKRRISVLLIVGFVAILIAGVVTVAAIRLNAARGAWWLELNYSSWRLDEDREPWDMMAIIPLNVHPGGALEGRGTIVLTADEVQAHPDIDCIADVTMYGTIAISGRYRLLTNTFAFDYPEIPEEGIPFEVEMMMFCDGEPLWEEPKLTTTEEAGVSISLVESSLAYELSWHRHSVESAVRFNNEIAAQDGAETASFLCLTFERGDEGCEREPGWTASVHRGEPPEVR